MDTISDNQLMARVRDGEVERLGVLFERHQLKLFNFFLRLTGDREVSEDLVQEVFLRMLKYRQSYASENAFGAWMYQIARNVHWDALRKKKPVRRLEEDESGALEEPVSEEEPPDIAVNRRQETRLLEEALARLPQDKREALVLSRFHHLTCEEIAGIVKCEPGTVRVRIHRALHELKTLLSHLIGEKAV